MAPKSSKIKARFNKIGNSIRNAAGLLRSNAEKIVTNVAKKSASSIAPLAQNALSGLSSVGARLPGAVIGAAGDAVLTTAQNFVGSVASQFSPQQVLRNFAAQGPFSGALIRRLFPNTDLANKEENPVVAALQQISAKLDNLNPTNSTSAQLVDYSPKFDLLAFKLEEIKQLSGPRSFSALTDNTSSQQDSIAGYITELRQLLTPLQDLREIRLQITNSTELLKLLASPKQNSTPSTDIVESIQDANPVALQQVKTVAQEREISDVVFTDVSNLANASEISSAPNTSNDTPILLSMDARLTAIVQLLSAQQQLLERAKEKELASADTDAATAAIEQNDSNPDDPPNDNNDSEGSSQEPKAERRGGLFELLGKGRSLFKSLGSKAGRQGLIKGAASSLKGVLGKGGLFGRAAAAVGLGGGAALGRDGITRGISSALGRAGITRGISRVLGGGAAKAALATGAKSLARFIPGVGLAVGGGIALSQLAQGQYGGAALNALGGVASLVPGIGTALSVGLGAAGDIVGARESAANKLRAASTNTQNNQNDTSPQQSSNPLEITIHPSPAQQQSEAPIVQPVMAPFSLAQIAQTQLFSYLSGGAMRPVF